MLVYQEVVTGVHFESKAFQRSLGNSFHQKML